MTAAERILAQAGWLVAALVLVLWVAQSVIIGRLDWMSDKAQLVGAQQSLAQQQQQIVQVLNDLMTGKVKPGQAAPMQPQDDRK